MKTNELVKWKDDGSLLLDFTNNTEIRVSGDLLFTIDGEVSILSLTDINLDSKNIHLNSRRCKQIREMELTILNALLEKIGAPSIVDPNKVKEARNEFKEQIKREIIEELRGQQQ